MTVDPRNFLLNTDYPMDKIISDFDGSYYYKNGVTAGSRTSSTIVNPVGKKAFLNLIWSIDGTNFYPQRIKCFNPDACCGGLVDDNNIYLYFTNSTGSTVDFTVFYVLDNIL